MTIWSMRQTVPGRIKVGSVLLEHKQRYQELRKISNREDVATSLDKQKTRKVWRYNVTNLQPLLVCVSSTWESEWYRTMQNVCHRCKQKFSSEAMIQVSLSADGEYANWTVERAEWFRSRWKKLPHLVWLCSTCYKAVQGAKK